MKTFLTCLFRPVRLRLRRCSSAVPGLATACLVFAHSGAAVELSEHARELRHEFTSRFMPYWYDTAQDLERGGFLLADSLKGRATPTEKQIVTQSRMIWTFSHAHHKGFRDEGRDYLKAAEQGYRFLMEHFYDREHGGYFWTTDLAGRPLNDRKIVYGQAFVLYALVEYHRASGSAEPLDRAMELYRALQKHAHDPKHGGWIEHFRRDWTPILQRESGAHVEVPGLKSANTHLHLMEAFAELYAVTRDKSVRNSLEESVRLNMDYFYPPEPGRSAFHRNPDWSAVKDPSSAGLSYGHNVEFAWLMVHAERILGREPSWDHFYAHINHALEYGYDHERGGLYNLGVENKPATDTRKVWWVQSEMLAALTVALDHRPNPAYARALDQLLKFVARHQADPKDGIWLDTVAADGKPLSPSKAHGWKANYHDGRAFVMFIKAFAEGK